MVSEPIGYGWQDPITDDEMIGLVRSHGGNAVAGWWDQVKRHSLGWVDARDRAGTLVGFVNVAWDGGDHAFRSFEASTSRHAASTPPTRA